MATCAHMLANDLLERGVDDAAEVSRRSDVGGQSVDVVQLERERALREAGEMGVTEIARVRRFIGHGRIDRSGRLGDDG